MAKLAIDRNHSRAWSKRQVARPYVTQSMWELAPGFI